MREREERGDESAVKERRDRERRRREIGVKRERRETYFRIKIMVGCIGKHYRHPWASVKSRASVVNGFLWFFFRFSLNIGKGIGYRESVASASSEYYVGVRTPAATGNNCLYL
jgi:hypothetical protein